MSKNRKTVASTYHYDPLNRLTGANNLQRFYNNTRVATEIEGERESRFFEVDSQPLALQQHGTAPGTTLFATDQQTSVLNGISAPGEQQAQAYSPFGYHPLDALLNVVGFNGERPDPVTGHYLLGQGYRAFNPVLMRFNNPDSWSPFGEGGINAYAYCDNNPMNEIDPNGHANFLSSLKSFGKGVGNALGLRQRKFKARVVDDLTSTASKTPIAMKKLSSGSTDLPLSPPSYESHTIKTSRTIDFSALPPPYKKSPATYVESRDINRSIQALDLPPNYTPAVGMDSGSLTMEVLQTRRENLQKHLGRALRQALGRDPLLARTPTSLNIPAAGARLTSEQLRQNRMLLIRANAHYRI